MSNLAKKFSHMVEREEVDSEGSWAISYGDMITLLLSFFIVFFTIDPTGQGKNNLKLKVSLIENLKAKSIIDSENITDDFISVGKEKKDGVDPRILKEWGGVTHDRGNHVIVEFPYISFFDSAKTELTKEGTKSLERFVRVFMPYAGNYYISIRAFADKRQVLSRGNLRFKDNIELTALRSVATMRVLQKAGVPLSRIRVGGYGEHLVTAKELDEIPVKLRKNTSDLDLARKVVLVIEPEVMK